eukprot:SAG22_NODE_9963_length_561_cov_0.500000_1_plen_65_part_10
MVCEADLLEDPAYMAEFALLYLTAAHIPTNASNAIAAWAQQAGGGGGGGGTGPALQPTGRHVVAT